jgi:excisionase family DNA binding protein
MTDTNNPLGATLEALAQRLAELVAERIPPAVEQHASTPWMTTSEAADYLRVPRGTFRQLTARGGPPRHREGRRLYFHRDELDAWMLER